MDIGLSISHGNPRRIITEGNMRNWWTILKSIYLLLKSPVRCIYSSLPSNEYQRLGNMKGYQHSCQVICPIISRMPSRLRWYGWSFMLENDVHWYAHKHQNKAITSLTYPKYEYVSSKFQCEMEISNFHQCPKICTSVIKCLQHLHL